MSRTSSTQQAGTMLQKDRFHTRSLDHIPQCETNSDKEVRTVTSVEEQPEPQSDKKRSTMIDVAKKGGEKPKIVVETGQPGMKLKSSSNLELSQTSGACSRAVERRRRFSEPERAVDCMWSAQRSEPTSEEDVLYSRSRAFTPQYRGNGDEDVRNTTSVKVQPQSDESSSAEIGIGKKMRQTVSEITICRLFLDAVFVLFAVSYLLASMGVVVPIIFLPNRGLRLGLDSSQASWLVAAMGISNTIGRVVCGLIADRKFVNRLMLFNVVRVIAGILSLFSVLFRTFPLLMCYSFVIGISYGTL